MTHHWTRDAAAPTPIMAGGKAMVSLVSEFWQFLRVRKKWWLAPIVVVLGLFGALIVFTQGSAVAPFIYTIF